MNTLSRGTRAILPMFRHYTAAAASALLEMHVDEAGKRQFPQPDHVIQIANARLRQPQPKI